MKRIKTTMKRSQCVKLLVMGAVCVGCSGYGAWQVWSRIPERIREYQTYQEALAVFGGQHHAFRLASKGFNRGDHQGAGDRAYLRNARRTGQRRLPSTAQPTRSRFVATGWRSTPVQAPPG